METGRYVLPTRLWLIGMIIGVIGCGLFVSEQQVIGRTLLGLGMVSTLSAIVLVVLRLNEKDQMEKID
jgi:MFS family permease